MHNKKHNRGWEEMSVELEITDGSPWWLSPDIWTVPGDDPDGAPGMPIVGEQCFLYARVTNNGTEGVQNATVRFYWANPSVGFDRNTANHIGDANVSLDVGETQDVLCLVPWMPTFVNGGHECVLAEAFHSSDPLPASPDFNVPTDRHVAQRNLSVLMMMQSQKTFSLSFQVCNTWRTERAFQISTQPGRVEELKALLPRINRTLAKTASNGKLAHVGFVDKPCPDEEERRHTKPTVERMVVKPGTCKGLSVVGELEGEAALLHVVQTADGKEVGGLSILVVRGNSARKEEK
jgi:hypothetical protein